MFRHDSASSEAVRCARLAKEARRTGNGARADKLEQRALALVGYVPPVAWEPSVFREGALGTLGKRLAGVVLGVALALGATDAGACEPSDWPGTYEWAMTRAHACPDDLGTSWVERNDSGAWLAVCGTDDGRPWLVVSP